MELKPGSYRYTHIMEHCRPCRRASCHACEYWTPATQDFGARIHARILGDRDRAKEATK